MNIKKEKNFDDGLVSQLFEAISNLNPMQSKFVENSWSALHDVEKEDFNKYLKYCICFGFSIYEVAKAYDLIVKDTFKEQVYFKRHGRYRYSSYLEVEKAVYQNPDYMKYYMIGLAVSGYLWPNHVELHRFFKHVINSDVQGSYLEVGPGHGYYFMEAAFSEKFNFCQGVDISPSSVEMTSHILNSGIFGLFSNWNVELCDFLEWNESKKYDFIVMAEVLEHVERPEEFLYKLRSLINPCGKVYITTCLNSPAIDHIYLYDSIDSLTSQVMAAGFLIEGQKVIPYVGATLEQSVEQALPINVAMVLKPYE